MQSAIARVDASCEAEPFAFPFPRDKARGGDAGASYYFSLGREGLHSAASRFGVPVEAFLAGVTCIVLFRYARPAAIGFSILRADESESVTCALSDESLPSDILAQIGSARNRVEQQLETFTLSFPALHEGTQIELRVRFSLNEQSTVLLECDTAVDPAFLEAMGGHLDTVAAALAAGSNVAIGQLPLLTAAQLRHALVDSNTTSKPYREDATLHLLFEEAVERYRDETALICGDERLTYQELNSRANCLAHRLIARGVGPETLVGVLIERTSALIVAVLAVLKTGAGYVPLDPSNPSARLELILEDAGVDLVLTQASLRVLLGESTAATIDVVAEVDSAYSESNPPQRGTPENVAYIIYTSGSTGKPKGVVIEHRSLTAFIAWTQNAFSAEELSGVLLASSIAFDVSVFELFAPLCAGGCAILVDDLFGLSESPHRNRVRIVSGTSSGLSVLANTTRFPLSVSTVMQAGELMHGTLAQALYAQPGVKRVVNLCGATEDTVYSVIYEVPRGASENPPIGKPFDNHEAYVLDGRLQPVPAGVPGDLYYAGLGLAREYFHRPDLTRDRFLPNPIETSSYRRLYKSGDICRYRLDGDLEYLSRADDQLKIRGYRVEINEIEGQLATHPAIAEIAVAARKSPIGETVLVAYAVLRNGVALSTTLLRQYASERLPEYMLPSALVVLPEFPLSPTGKLDRAALPNPKFDGGTAGPIDSEGKGDTQSVLVDMWRRVLGLERVGVDQNFFELGGHSLIAMRLLARIREHFGVTLRMREFFSDPRIEAIAQKIDAYVPTQGRLQEPIGLDAIPSLAQQQLWFLEKILPDHSVYNVPIGIRIVGTVDEVALARALDALLARHEQLRAHFPERNGTPLIEIDPGRTMPLERIEANAANIVELCERTAREPFNLQTGPLVRSTLFRMGDREQILLLNMHHIVTDGWSDGVLYEELCAFYEAFSQGRTPALPALTATYADYAVADSSAAANGSYEADLLYWTEHLAGAPRVELPGDRAIPSAPTFNGGRFTFELDTRTTEAIRAVARSAGATVASVLLATYAALISRYTGEDDLVIGMPTVGRTMSHLEKVVGYFVGVAAMRIDTSGSITYRDLIERTANVMFDGIDHQPVPIQMLVERLAPQRSGLKNPLFALAFVAQTALEPREQAETRFEIYPVQTRTSKFDLLFEVTEGRQSISCDFEYSTDLYDSARITDMARSFVTLLQSALEQPESALSSIDIVDPSDAAALTSLPIQYIDAQADVPVYRRFETWALECPDAVAVRFGDERMSYGELNHLSERLARRLHELGAGPGGYVGICAQRTPLVLAAILAVAKCGAAYVPLDPQYPAQRLAFISHDAELKIVLVDRSSLDVVTESGVRYLVLEEMALVEPSATSLTGPGAEDPAYVIYTSGSTGTPKGVIVTHRNVSRLLLAGDSIYSFRRSDVWTLFHSYAFDFSVWEIWGSLAYGGTLVIVPADVARNPHEFRRLLQEMDVTVLNQTPSAFYALVEADRGEAMPLAALRYVIFGGEALDVRRLRPWFERYGEDRPELVNMYGITETTVHTTHRRITRRDESGPFGRIGVPLDDLQIYLLDRGGMPVPAGAVGEIFVAGEGVARGYLNREELTAARFVANPFASAAPRIYRSGDLARRLLDGSYEYVGRNDDQVKVRGFRIELGEIEAVLAGHPAVARVVVVAELGAETQLKSYIILRDAQADLPDLRTYLAARLPAHMIPAAFYRVREIPLTENGKLDRRALAALAETPGSPLFGSQPTTPMERTLVELFAKTLALETVGVDDNFFFLGGHSLLAARLIATVETAFRDEVARLRTVDGRSPLFATFYVDPTVRGLAATLLHARTFEDGRMIRLRAGVPEQTPLIWFHGMFNGDGLYAWNVVESLHHDRPVWVIHPHGYDGQPFDADIKALAQEHLALLRTQRPHGPYHLGGFCNGALIAYEVATMLEADGEIVESLFLVSPPPMVAAMERLIGLCDRIAKALHVDRRRRVALHSYLYSYARRTEAFVRAPGIERWKQLRRGWELTMRKLRRRDTRFSQGELPQDFSNPHFKNHWYLRAIAEYIPSGYRGAIEIVWGRKTVVNAGNPSGGWSKLGRTVHVHYVDGGHFCVIDSPESVGALLGATIESHDIAQYA